MLQGKQKLKDKSVEEVVSILQTYKADMMHSESRKTKTKSLTKLISFSSSRKGNKDSGSDDECDFEAMTLFTKQFKKFS